MPGSHDLEKSSSLSDADIEEWFSEEDDEATDRSAPPPEVGGAKVRRVATARSTN